MTTYRLLFGKRARKDWDRLDEGVRRRFQRKLKERLQHPHVPSARLRDIPNAYKIKLSSVGYRLVYQVRERQLIVIVIAVGQRENDEAYEKAIAALARLDDRD